MNRKTKGKRGEQIACKHYESLGSDILETNYRFSRNEIDIIALEKEALLIFIEVKFRSNKDYGEAETFVGEKQQERIKEAADEYIYSINWKGDIRFDIACVDMNDKIEIFKDAF